ncbi:NYN domain-containing protein [Streptomyces sp. NPDC001093]|uniref:NYN domain-containing protein n=1 Tax=Streptomyces sp. NPDC001093 TaxID=3154376 RepID=UPI0033285D1B
MGTTAHGGGTEPRKAALFVDFDNIYLGLRKFAGEAAEAFATHPTQWMNWLEAGSDTAAAPPGNHARRFLVRNVYLNPGPFSPYRAVFTSSGFRAIDCPTLTAQGKNSADIHIVLDIMDALANQTRYDEFVIMSADADFTPVLRRLRAQDRWTTVVTAGLSAPALRANCDTLVTPEQLVAAILGETSESAETALDYVPAPLRASSAPAREFAGERAQAEPSGDVEAVAVAIRDAVRRNPRPLAASSAAQAALAVDPEIKTSGWYGAGSFRAFVERHLHDLRYEPGGAGYVVDPALRPADGTPSDERLERDPFLQRVRTVTGVPALPSQAYGTLFRVLAEDLQEHPFHLTETSKRVRDQTDLQGTPVPRSAISFVIKGLTYAKQKLTDEATAEALADAWVDNIYTLCANEQMPLTEEDRQAIRAWVTDNVVPESTGSAEGPDS